MDLNEAIKSIKDVLDTRITAERFDGTEVEDTVGGHFAEQNITIPIENILIDTFGPQGLYEFCALVNRLNGPALMDFASDVEKRIENLNGNKFAKVEGLSETVLDEIAGMVPCISTEGTTLIPCGVLLDDAEVLNIVWDKITGYVK